MIRTYKRKLILTKAQEQHLIGWIGVCRLVHNMCIEIRNSAYAGGKQVHKYALARQLKDLRAGFKWIEDVPFDSLECSVFRVDKAYANFFRGNGFPKFATKKKYKSITFRVIKVDGRKIRIPKIGFVKMVNDSAIIGEVKNAIVKIEPTGFFIYIVCDNVPKKFDSENQAIGLDMGIAQFCVDSIGNFISNPGHFKKYERLLRIENRSLARKKRGSEGWKKQCRIVARLHHKIGNLRMDFLHKESTKIAKAYNVVAIEDLNVSGMSRNKSLSKHILDCGWGMFRIMLEYKTNVIAVDPRHTSQACNVCGSVDKENRLSQSEFVCLECGHIDNADINAAKNILSRGTAIVRQREALACALGEESNSRDMSESTYISLKTNRPT